MIYVLRVHTMTPLAVLFANVTVALLAMAVPANEPRNVQAMKIVLKTMFAKMVFVFAWRVMNAIHPICK